MSDAPYDIARISIVHTAVAPRVTIRPGTAEGSDGGLCGPPGASTTVGFGYPASTLGYDGDSYIDGTTGNIWQRASGIWTNSGMAIGQGSQAGETLALTDDSGRPLTDNNGMPLIVDFALSSSQSALALTDNNGNAITDDFGNPLVIG